MFKTLYERIRQGNRTVDFPYGPPAIPARLRGVPEIDTIRCRKACSECIEVCPVGALEKTEKGKVRMDLGKCLFCGECVKACPHAALGFTADWRLAVRERSDLLVEDSILKLAESLQGKMKRVFGRSLKLRQVSAGGCTGCELDINVLTTVVFDLGRFGIQIVASPRHADGLIITGPVTANMRPALIKTYDAVADPKIVIAVGSCAISGGPFIGHPEVSNGVDPIIPVDLYIPGCPPHPVTILDGLLRLLGRMPEERSGKRPS
ncbi:MAG: NADH-quinone oxidoreductase subunit NuoB [Candidatus Omnitrophota bacterium]